ncbi:glycoside hydrolase family 65 protein [Lacticaseibacillus yichunensis]|uniref:Glycoside hydrolase family 65 protein n=1 Tax=Lacticaseibacillus yichunensis TaxID=2486015 RepID=A0ABW4CV60_9LACO|nr:glycosyl hydrolase family 65 protein [Lacticaseibacillus yichunensis]
METTIRYPKDDPWRISEATFDPRFLGKYETIFALGNGYLGARAATEERYVGEKRDTFIAGTFDRFDQDEVTELPNIPDVFAVTVILDGQQLDLNQGEVSEYDRTLNVRTGELTRRFIWTYAGKQYRFQSSRFVSFKQRHVLAERISITPVAANASIRLTAGIDGQMTNNGTQHFNDDVKRLYPGQVLQLSAKTDQSEIYFVLTSEHRFSTEGVTMGKTKTEMLRRQLMSTYTADVEAGHPFVFTNITNVYTSRDIDVIYKDRSSLQAQGLETAEALKPFSYEALQKESAQAWADKIWDAMPITIDADESRDALAINFARYHLAVMTPAHDPRMNIGAKGLSGEGYKGHTFWDTEIFMLPYYIFTYPEVAKKLETYRFLSLGGARRKASDNGYHGAQYPWESAWIDDGESTPVWGATDIVTGKATKIWSGFIEQHITADVAYGINEYIQATGDQEFAETMGHEVILDTARFWASRLDWNEDKHQYEILDVIGPDEYKEHANNNAFTNHMAKWNMQLGLDLIKKLRDTAPAEYTRLDDRLNLDQLEQEVSEKIDKLYLPEPNANDVIPQDDDYLSKKLIDLAPYTVNGKVGSLFDHFNLDQVDQMQVTKQADVILLLFLFEKHFSKDVKLKNWEYYEPKTTHDSSLSLLTHTIFAADLGDKKMAYDFYQRARDIDMGTNMSSSDEGIHAASIGGIWSMTVFGFGGVRYLDGNLRIVPNLPDAWHELSFQIWWHQQKLAITETHDALKIKNLTGTADIQLDSVGGSYTVSGHDELVIKLA